MKALVGIVTYGCLPLTKKAVASVCDMPLFVVVGKPGDQETARWLDSQGIRFHSHSANMGFASSVNDIIDEWLRTRYEHLILMGNDVVARKDAVKKLRDVARSTDIDIIDATSEDGIVRLDNAGRIGADIFNLTLFKRSVFDAIGYVDVNFWPCYFTDNDYLARAHRAGLTAIRAADAKYIHVRSAVLKREHTEESHERFRRNRQYFCRRWGGPPEDIRSSEPMPVRLDGALMLGGLRISSRENEGRFVNYWSMSPN